MRIIYNLVSSFVLWVLPLIVVFYSFVWSISDPNAYFRAFETTNFYSEMSRLSRENAQIETLDTRTKIGDLFILSILQNFDEDQWRDLVEGNVYALTEWFSGESPYLVLYIPTNQVENVVKEKIDQNIQKFIDQNENGFLVCSEQEAKQIKQQGGFDPSQTICIPAEVKSGEQSFLDFFGNESGRVLDQLLQNNFLSLQRDRYSINELIMPQGIKNFLNGPLNFVRDFLLAAKKATLIVLLVCLAMFGAYIVLAFLAGKEIYLELATFFRSLSTGIIISAVALMLFFGGSFYLNATLLSLISPVFALSQITNLILLTIVHLVFNMVFWAIFCSISSVVLYFVMKFLHKQMKREIYTKNQQILEYQPDYYKAKTFDSEFKRQMQFNKPDQNATSLSNTNYYQDQTLSQSRSPIQDFAQFQFQQSNLQAITTATDSSNEQPQRFPPEFFQKEENQNNSTESKRFDQYKAQPQEQTQQTTPPKKIQL